MFDKLPGKKTYIIIVGLLAWKASEVFAGDLPVDQFIDYIFGGGLLAAAKAGWERNK